MAGNVSPQIGGFALAARATESTAQVLGPLITNPPLYSFAFLWRPANLATTVVSGGAQRGPSFSNQAATVDAGLEWNSNSAAYQQAWFHRTSGGSFPVAQYVTILQPGTLYRCVATYDGNFIRAYLNGRLEAVSGAAALLAVDPLTRFSFGNPFRGSSGAALGEGAEIALWRAPLSARQVAQLDVNWDIGSVAPDYLVDWFRVYQGGVVSMRGSPLTQTTMEIVPIRDKIVRVSRGRFGWRLAAAVAPGESQVRGWGPLIAGQRSRLVRI